MDMQATDKRLRPIPTAVRCAAQDALQRAPELHGGGVAPPPLGLERLDLAVAVSVTLVEAPPGAEATAIAKR